MAAGQLMSRRRGFTLVELLVAVVVLTIVATTFARFAGGFALAMANSSVRLVSSAVATDRLELVRADPRYTRLVQLYGAGAGADTTGFPGYPRMRRVTMVVRDTSGAAPSRDRTTVTVLVTDPSYKDTVAVTAVIARP
jgi:prepilin-type N-terminal cleavage/methylation domain-containing protein